MSRRFPQKLKETQLAISNKQKETDINTIQSSTSNKVFALLYLPVKKGLHKLLKSYIPFSFRPIIKGTSEITEFDATAVPVPNLRSGLPFLLFDTCLIKKQSFSAEQIEAYVTKLLHTFLNHFFFLNYPIPRENQKKSKDSFFIWKFAGFQV